MATPKEVVIIGCGVIGLTIAYELSRKYKPDEVSITIIARDTPKNGLNSTGWASPWAGANWCPFLNRDPENRWEVATYARFKADVPKEFILWLPTTYFSTKTEDDLIKDIWYGDVVGGIKSTSQTYPTFTDGKHVVASGVEFTTLSYNVPAYLAWLYEQITSRGVKVVEGWVGSFADVEFVPGSENQVKTDVIVNASGLGAKSIVGVADPLVLPVRGQTVLVRAPSVKSCVMVMSPTQVTYMIPRANGDVVLGGTMEAGDWNVSPDPETARGILERALEFCPELATAPSDPSKPGIADIKILRHNVGLRPARTGGARVEKETVNLPSKTPWGVVGPLAVPLNPDGMSVDDIDHRPKKDEAKNLKVVHAYGFGPAGYQESWGAAEDVVRLVEESF